MPRSSAMLTPGASMGGHTSSASAMQAQSLRINERRRDDLSLNDSPQVMNHQALAHSGRSALEHAERNRPSQLGTHRTGGDVALGACRRDSLGNLSADRKQGA